MAVEGTLDLFRLPEILQLISQQNKTGILTVQGQQDIVAVSFLNGRIVAADALTQTVEEGLAQVLVSQELVSAGDFSRAVAENLAAGGRLLDALVERGLVTRAKLLAALRVQTQHQLQRLLRWEQGDFKFYSGDEVSYEDGFLPIAVEDLLLESLQDFADRPLRPPPPLPAFPIPAAAATAAGAGAAAAGMLAPAGPAASSPLPAAGDSDSPDLPVTKVFPAPPASQVFPIALPPLPPSPPSPLPRTAHPAGAAAAAKTDGGAKAEFVAGEDAGLQHGALPRSSRVMPIRPGLSRQGRASSVAAADSGRPRALPAEAPLTPPAPEPPLPKKFRKMELARPKEGLPGVEVAAAALLAALLAAGVIAALALRPAVLTSPLPWQAAERAALTQQQQQALYLKIDRGAKTFFLLEGRFPDSLQQLADMGLISPGDFEDSERRPLQYSVREETYTLRPLAGGRPVADLETSASVSGNFLLDPQLLVPVPTTAPPIVLLD
jgi:hypothetical protein